jgi:glycosyltransferase involved in cell wall biosynthesis
MTLSVCLITKNEQNNLERALSSIKPVADEIIVTDTGSTDDTILIAKDFGAKISHFDWCDDFSAARNFCFSQAACNWILWLDADEELLAESVDELRRCMSRDDVFVFMVVRQDLIDPALPDFYSEMYLPRLFQRHDNINLVGRIHEHFNSDSIRAIAQNKKIYEASNVGIRHYGFIAGAKPEKYKRDVKLLELELRDRPDRLYYQIELYRTLLLLNDERWKNAFAEAAANLFAYINADEPPVPQAALLIETLLQLPDKKLPEGFSKSKLKELAEIWFPRSAPLLWILAKQDYENSRFEQAEQRLRLLIQMGKEHSYDRTVGFDPHIFAEDAHLNLAVCLIRQAKLDEAVQILKPLTLSKTHRKAAEQNIQAVAKLRRKDAPIRPRRIKRKRSR